MVLVLYLLSIILANVITAAFAPMQLGIFLVPWGSWLIGATFILRDIIQVKYGRKTAYLAITVALVLSAVTSKLLGDTLAITIASAVSFFISEATDTEIYTRFKTSFLKRVFTSGVISSFLDSAIFVTIGLSPLISGFLPWEAIPYAIMEQFIVKSVMQLIGIAVLYLFKPYKGVSLNER